MSSLFAATRNMSGTVAFIGIGNMGARMSKNLIKKGTKLRVYDVLPSAAQSVQGAVVCKSPAEAASEASIVITMLPDGSVVRDAVSGDNGILKGIKKGSLYVDCSTVEPKLAQELSQIAKENDIRFLDAPVSGGVTGAEAATLTFMVGGPKKDVDYVEPVLLRAGARLFHCGDYGAGQAAKLCNNLLLASSMIATAEAMNLGIKLGLDPKVLNSIVNTSTGRCWSSETYNPVPGLNQNVPSSVDYEGGFFVKLVAKDLNLAENAAIGCDAPLPLTAASHQIFRTMMAHGYATKDFSSVYKYFKGK